MISTDLTYHSQFVLHNPKRHVPTHINLNTTSQNSYCTFSPTSPAHASLPPQHKTCQTLFVTFPDKTCRFFICDTFPKLHDFLWSVSGKRLLLERLVSCRFPKPWYRVSYYWKLQYPTLSCTPPPQLALPHHKVHSPTSNCTPPPQFVLPKLKMIFPK